MVGVAPAGPFGICPRSAFAMPSLGPALRCALRTQGPAEAAVTRRPEWIQQATGTGTRGSASQ
jgi:hypothetical protein